MHHLTDPEEIFKNVCETLRQLDPNFAKEEQQYLETLKNLQKAIGDSVSPSASEYAAAKKQKLCAELVYLTWLGFRQNLECFQNPVNTMFLKMDSEVFLREGRMHTLTGVDKALQTICAFDERIRGLAEDNHLLDGIDDYISYLETTGYKLAHYFGFLLADRFLYHVIPGYTSDPATIAQYARELRKYLHLDVGALE